MYSSSTAQLKVTRGAELTPQQETESVLTSNPSIMDSQQYQDGFFVSSKSLGLIAAVVTSSIVISALFVVLILCCVCRSNRRSSGANGGTGLGSSNSRHSGGRRHMRGVAVVGGGSHRQSSGAIGSVGQGSGKCQQNYSEGQRADQNSMSDYEVSPHCSLCCLSLRCRSLKRTEDSSSSDANYCIKDSSFVFKNGKSLELSEFNQYTMSSEKLSPTFDNYSIHGCSKNTTSNKSNTSQPSTLKSLQNQKISQLNCTIEDYASLTQATAATAIPGAHDYAPLHKSSTLNNQNSFETSLDEDSAAAAAGGDLGVNGQQLHTTTIQPELETPYLPSNTVRLSRQDSEKRREADRIQKAQENAFKLRHVSPVRLRSASETIFGTNSGKETILDLLQSKEPEEVLALKIELISQIYESLKLSDLSSDIVKEMTLEMEKVSQFVSLNLGRAFIDNFDLKIKAKSVTCAQLLAKVFKHKGSQISVSQFLHFLHQFGDRQVAEAYCDLLIRWYRHETSRHRMTGQFMQQNQAYSSAAATLTNDTTTLNPAYAMSLGSSFAGSHTASAQLGYGTPGVSHNRHHMMAPMSRHSLAVPTNVQVQPFSSQQRHSLNQQQIQGIPNSSQVMSMATEGGGGGGDTKYNSLFKQQQHEQKLHPMQLSSNAFNVQQQHNNHQFTPTNNTVGTNVPGHHHFMQQQQQQHPNSLPLHQSLHYALTDVPVHGFRGQAQAIQLGVQGGGGVMTPPSAQQGMLQPQQRFMPQEEMNSECGEDDVFA